MHFLMMRLLRNCEWEVLVIYDYNTKKTIFPPQTSCDEKMAFSMNSNILPDCQNIAAILIFIAHIFHIFLDHIDTQSADLPLIRR